MSALFWAWTAILGLLVVGLLVLTVLMFAPGGALRGGGQSRQSRRRTLETDAPGATSPVGHAESPGAAERVASAPSPRRVAAVAAGVAVLVFVGAVVFGIVEAVSNHG